MKSATYITTSIFDLFKVGPGPSSSHTIGPMKAAFRFRKDLEAFCEQHPEEDELSIIVHLYGSLSATGKGHGTDKAVLGGLLGWLPENCDPVQLSALLEKPGESYAISAGGKEIVVKPDFIVFEKRKYVSPHPNTLVLCLINNRGEALLESEYYSVGGGFIQKKGEVESTVDPAVLPYPYSTMDELKEHLKTGVSLTDLMIANETAVSGLNRKEIMSGIDKILSVMHKAVRRGLKNKGVLPGKIKLTRKAPVLFDQARQQAQSSDGFLLFLNSYSLAASEENAAGNIVVTAPTSGASGVIPGLTYLMKHHFHHNPDKMRNGMLAAAAIGFLVKHNASISGAEMGCMGEVGTASAMGGAMLAYSAGKSIQVVEAAAEIGIEHHLGMTCDPIGGYVQIPCIERNAMGAAKAYNAYLLASSGASVFQKISLDSVIKVMKATGRDMSKKYKETSEGGLALSMTEC